MTETKLRSMSATVNTRTLNDHTIFFLKSYETYVAAYYPVANAIYFAPKYACSVTTKKHVRAFFADYAGASLSIPDVREQLTGARWDGEQRTLMVGGRLFNAYTCSQSQFTDMLWRSKS